MVSVLRHIRRYPVLSLAALAILIRMAMEVIPPLMAPTVIPRTDPDIAARFAVPADGLDQAGAVFHLGHSLVGRDMPVMLQQLTAAHFGTAPDHHSQLGWGTPLRAHWDPAETINGFDTENAHPHYRDAKEALTSGDYDAVVLTEMIEIRDAIAYFDSAEALTNWARLARQGNPNVRIYFYETWHEVTDPAGWLTRLDLDLDRYWTGQILFPALLNLPEATRIHVIPTGQVMAAVTRAVEARGGMPGMQDRNDLFARTESGDLDPIHINDLGAYLTALTHFATIYQRSPVGLPHELTRTDGSAFNPIPAETARLMQEITWEVVKTQPLSGIFAENPTK
jgi:hypothetical protein